MFLYLTSRLWIVTFNLVIPSGGMTVFSLTPTEELNTCNLLMTNGVFPALAINISWLTLFFLINGILRSIFVSEMWMEGAFKESFLRHTREIRKKNGRNGYLIIFTHFITGETGQVDRGLCQSEVLQLAGIQCQLDRSFLPFSSTLGSASIFR